MRGQLLRSWQGRQEGGRGWGDRGHHAALGQPEPEPWESRSQGRQPGGRRAVGNAAHGADLVSLECGEDPRGSGVEMNCRASRCTCTAQMPPGAGGAGRQVQPGDRTGAGGSGPPALLNCGVRVPGWRPWGSCAPGWGQQGLQLGSLGPSQEHPSFSWRLGE